MRRIRYRPRAKRDIDQIWSYTIETFGQVKAIEYVRSLQAALLLVEANPSLARDAHIGRPGLKRYRSGSHVLFFHLEDTYVDVVRILHERMDFSRHV